MAYVSNLTIYLDGTCLQFDHIPRWHMSQFDHIPRWHMSLSIQTHFHVCLCLNNNELKAKQSFLISFSSLLQYFIT
jgi:hypothetical protein